ncbi:MAG: hypothetical protein GY854_33510 [Deltaproteobacteria bacterium]|nr:hypothetical protein [Deltaproteobacteria bacterium]
MAATSRLEAGAPSAIEVVGTRYAPPASRLEAGAPSALEAVGTRYAWPTSRLEAGAPSAIEVVPIRRKRPNVIVASLVTCLSVCGRPVAPSAPSDRPNRTQIWT